MPRSRGVTYGVCQAIGWSVWGAMNFTFFVLSEIGVHVGTIAWSVAADASHWVATSKWALDSGSPELQ